MAFCSNCGTKLNDGAKFCTNCGAAQPVAAPAQPQSAPVEEPVTVAEQSPVQEYQAPAQEYQAPQQSYQASAQEYQAPQQSYQAPAQEYQAPQQSYQASAQEYQAPQQSYQAPAQEYQAPQQGYQYQAPQQNYQAYQQPVNNGKAKKPKKKVNPLAIILPIAGVVLAGIIVLLVVLLGGGKVDKKVYGKYEIVAEAAMGYACDTQGEWVELKKGGKGTYYSGYEFKLKWELEDTAFNGTVSFLGLEDSMTGTLENNVLAVTYGDYELVFVKEGETLPEGYELPGISAADTEALEEDAGYYYICSMEAQDVTLGYEELTAGGMTGAYLWLLSDGTGEILLAAADDYVEITWEPGIIHYFGQDLSYTREGDIITVDFTGGTTMSYSLTPPEDVSDVTATDIDYDLIFGLENDWHGMCQFTGCTGDYEELNDSYMEIIARFTFADDGTPVPYVRTFITGSEDDNLHFDDSSYLDSESGALVVNGTFNGMDFVYPAYFYYDEYERCVTFYLTVADGEDAISFYGTLRLLDDDWSTEYYVGIPDGFYDYYEGYSLYDLVELYELDWDNVPELTHVGENAMGIATEGAPTGDAGTDDDYAGWDRNLCDESASYDLQTMAECYKWFVGLSYDESAAQTYEDFCEKLGGKGKPFYDSSTPEELHVWWTDADNTGYFAANFELNADGEIVVIMGTVTVGNAAHEAYQKIK